MIIESYSLYTYITNNYMTLLLLGVFGMMCFSNRNMKVERLRYAKFIAGIVAALTLCEAAEDICDIYSLSIHILYVKTTLVYLLYPLSAMLLLFLVTPVRHKLIIAVPYFVSSALSIIDLFDTRLVYFFGERHNYNGGPLNLMPEIILGFYVLMLVVYSIKLLAKSSYSKSIILMFMAVSTAVTEIGETVGFSVGYSETVMAVELIVYYFFLTSVEHSRTQRDLYESRIALEKNKIKLLVAQIRPHFIFNALMTIKSLCYTDSEKAADCIDVFGDYLRANIDSLSSDEPIEFQKELEHISRYVELERTGIDFDFRMIIDMETVDFTIPQLTVQPLVENAVKHGAMTRRDGSGIVTIRTRSVEDKIIITVTDNGLGADLTANQKEHRSAGIENIRQRLKLQCGGTLEVNIFDGGCAAKIEIPRQNAETAEGRKEKNK